MPKMNSRTWDRQGSSPSPAAAALLPAHHTHLHSVTHLVIITILIFCNEALNGPCWPSDKSEFSQSLECPLNPNYPRPLPQYCRDIPRAWEREAGFGDRQNRERGAEGRQR